MALNNNVTISVMRKLAMQVAEFWTQFIRPMPFDAVFHVNGVRVEIRVQEYKTAQDTKPVFDEDNGIAD